MEYDFEIKREEENLRIKLENGQTLYVLGANGVGKSILMLNIYVQKKDVSKRILAHRKTWFTGNSLDFTPSQKKQTEDNIKNRDQQTQSRWKDDFYTQRTSISLFDLINSENVRARKITKAVDRNDIDLAQKLAQSKSPLDSLNELLKLSNLPIVISVEKDELLFASKNGSEPYSIAELSDGERNALLIATDVLTADENTLIIIDEPEKHLHRSIISPLLNSLFKKRTDCAFIISTHDVSLANDNEECKALLVRGCNWQNKAIKTWDVDYIEDSSNVSTQFKLDILGAKRKILFVEGTRESLDLQIYHLIFPEVTVVPQESCTMVEKSVDGVKNTENLHWIKPYGLIDADDRTSDVIDKLREKGILALKCYSVEYLYYNLFTIKKVSETFAKMTGKNSDELYKEAIEKIIKFIEPHKNRLCARVSERKVRNLVMNGLPTHNDILTEKEFKREINLEKILTDETKRFEKFVSNSELDNLLSHYPIRETQVLTEITKSIGISRSDFENIIRTLIIEDSDTLDYYHSFLQELKIMIDEKP